MKCAPFLLEYRLTVMAMSPGKEKMFQGAAIAVKTKKYRENTKKSKILLTY